MISTLRVSGLLCLAAASAHANVWTTESVQEGAQVIEVSRQALVHDPAGRPHYFYGGSHLYHKYFDGQAWQREIVDQAPRTGRFARATIGSDGRFHVAYLDEYSSGPNSKRVRYAVGGPGSWTTEEIPVIPAVIFSDSVFDSIAVDSSGVPYIARRECLQNPGILLHRKSGGSWTTETAASLTGCESGGDPQTRLVSVVIDGNDQPHVLYYFDSDGTLRHSRRSGGAWTAEVVASAGHNEHSSFARGPGDVLYACYMAQEQTPVLYCANNASGSWQQTLVDAGGDLGTTRQVGAYPSVFVDTSGAVHVSYYALQQNPSSTYFIRYATNVSGTWSVRSVATNLIFPSPTIFGRDGTGNPILGYKERGDPSILLGIDSALKRLAWNGTGWDTTDVDTGFPVPRPAGISPSVTVDATGFMHAAYLFQDVQTFYLEYATNKTGSWISEKFGAVGTVTGSLATPRVKTDELGAAHIVFAENLNSSSTLKYRTNRTGNWVESEISPINWPGGSRETLTISYVLKNGTSHVAFIVRTPLKAELHYVTDATGTWSDLLVFDFGSENQEISSFFSGRDEIVWADLAVEGNGDVDILFGHSDLKHAKITAGAVSVQTVLAPKFGEQWGRRSLAITSAGVKYLALEKFVSCVGTFCPAGMYLNSDETGQWQESVVDSEVYFDPVQLVFFTPRDPVLSVNGSVVKLAYYHEFYEHVRVASRGLCGYTSVIASDSSFRIDSELNYNIAGRSFSGINSLPNGLAKIVYYDQANGRLVAGQSSPGLSFCATVGPFANVAVGASAESDFVVSNESGLSANVTPVADLISNPFSIVGDACTGRSLAPGSTCTIRLKFTPTSPLPTSSPFAVAYALASGQEQVIFSSVEANTTVSAPSSPPGGSGAAANSGSDSRCFIATAAFGSPLAAEVDFLRKFRDKYLMVNSPGRAFVSWYYRHSPPVADFLRTHDHVRFAVRLLLTAVVETIKPLVTDDTPAQQLKRAHPEKGDSQEQATQVGAPHGLRRNPLGTVRHRALKRVV